MPPSPLTDDEPVLLSVIIPCRNAERYVSTQLEALAAQEACFPWELVFVDNGSTDRSAQIAWTYRDRIRLRVVSAPDRANLPYARNVGVKEARSEKLVFVDADDEVAPGFLATMFASLEEHEFVTPTRDLGILNPEWTLVAHTMPASAYGTFSPYAYGAAMGMSRRAYESVGGTPEAFKACDDMALSYLLQQSGVALLFVPDVLYRYRLRSSIRGLFKQTQTWGYYQALAYREFGSAFLARRSASLTVSEWFAIVRELITARSRSDLARFAIRTGYSVGRLRGSLRYGVFYL